MIEKSHHLDLVLKQQNLQNMGGGYYFLGDNCHLYGIVEDIFTPEETAAIINIGTDLGLTDGLTAGGVTSKARKSLVSFMYPSDFTHWIFDKVTRATLEANKTFFHFDLHGLFQGLQFTAYHAPGQHYDWHVDMGTAMARKLSVSIQLSDPNDYEGGLLQLQNGGQEVTVQPKHGAACFFPSWTLHRVTPVTKGTRYSLVVWASGPPFR